MTVTTVRDVRAQLDGGQLTADAAIEPLVQLARTGPTRATRLDAARVLGDLAGRAHGAAWEAAEKAAFALLELARLADAPPDRRGVILAMGRGFRNLWLLPYVHRRLSDDDPEVVAAAINAAGGLGFPALEEAVAAFLGDDVARPLRLAAIAALGRMGAMSVVDRLVPLCSGDPTEAAAALDALTEIRSPAAIEAAEAALAADPEPEVRVAALRYLAELGGLAALPTMRRLARDDDAAMRLAASFASRALKAERAKDAGERFLVALTENDRQVRAVLARRLRTVEIATVLEHAELLIGDDAEGVVQVLGELREPEITRYLLEVAARAELPVLVRRRAIGAIEANLPWERDALAAIAGDDDAPEPVRAAAAQTIGAFASVDDVLGKVGALAGADAPALRGAFLWALQLAARPGQVTDADAGRLADAVRPLLGDADPGVRRRAAYVTGNLGLGALAPQLAELAGGGATPDLRLAGWVALGEMHVPGVFNELVERRQEGGRRPGPVGGEPDPGRDHRGQPRAAPPLGLAHKLGQMLNHADPLVREAGVRLAGLGRGTVARRPSPSSPTTTRRRSGPRP